MKQFKDYLTESTKVYPFRIKVAGNIPEQFEKKMKSVLSKFSVENISKGKRSPIQSMPLDFPNLKDTEVTMYEVNLKYPTTSHSLTEFLIDNLGIVAERIRVRNPAEQSEIDMQQASLLDDFKSDPKGSLLTQEYEAGNNQAMAGEKRISEFMKELSAMRGKHSGTPYTGTNDQILADGAPKEKAPPTVEDSGKISPIGSRQNKIPDAYQAKGKGKSK